jgi:hypothetical protein
MHEEILGHLAAAEGPLHEQPDFWQEMAAPPVVGRRSPGGRRIRRASASFGARCAT